MFQWNTATGDLHVASQIWIYWATTIPLTLLTIGMWWVWLRFRTGQEQAQLRMVEDFDELSNLPGDDDGSLGPALCTKQVSAAATKNELGK